MASNNRITLYDLQLASGCTISPFVWRTKYALAHKGFDIDIVPGGFTGILERTGGRSERVPVIVDDGEWVLDSWLIAEYLDEKYPDRPTLFEGPSMKVLTKFIDGWLWRTAIAPVVPLLHPRLSRPLAAAGPGLRPLEPRAMVPGRAEARGGAGRPRGSPAAGAAAARTAAPAACATRDGWAAIRRTTPIFPRSPCSCGPRRSRRRRR